MQRRVFIIAGVVALGLSGFFIWRIFQNKQVVPTFNLSEAGPSLSSVGSVSAQWASYQQEAETIFGGDKAVIQIIKSVLGANVFLRDVEPVAGEPNIYLVVYIENPVFDPDPDLSLAEKGLLYFSCPETTIGQGISGTYHLAAFKSDGQAVDLINDEVLHLPLKNDNPVPEQPRLSFKNTRFNLEPSTACQAGFDKCREDQKTILVAKLLKFNDLTGDGKPNEFRIVGDQTPCGHIEMGIAGYSSKAIVYPILVGKSEQSVMFDNFAPDENGEVRWQFGCGDHGNQTEQNKLFRFDAKEQAYVLISSSERSCE